MNAVAFLAGYLHKEAELGSMQSFGSAVGNATKKFMDGSLGGGNIAREENLPKSKFIPKYETVQEVMLSSGLKHPVRADSDDLLQRAKENAQ